MAAGFPSNKDAIDLKVGSLVVKLRDTLAEIERTDAWLWERTDEQLIAVGYTQADVDTLRASFGALSKLARIARAQDTAPSVDNFFDKAKKLMGLN